MAVDGCLTLVRVKNCLKKPLLMAMGLAFKHVIADCHKRTFNFVGYVLSEAAI